MTTIEQSSSIGRPASAGELRPMIERLLKRHQAEAGRLRTIAEWVSGRTNGLYIPRRHTAEYRRLVEQSQFNVLPLIVTTVAQALYVEGYRPTGPNGRAASGANAPIWDRVWQANRMDARQAILWRAAIKYGWSYAVVTPSTPAPRINLFSPRSLTAIYGDSDEWPEAAMVTRRPLVTDAVNQDPLTVPAVDQGTRLQIYDRWFRYHVTKGPADWELDTEAEFHGLGEVPVVRFLDEQSNDDDPLVPSIGKVEPLIPAQQQLNQISYSLAMALHYAAFRQRWVTGMAIAEDPDGNPVEPFNPAVDTIFHAESAGTKFGEFGQTDPSGYLDARDKVLAFMTSVAQVPPHSMILGEGISNISAEAMAALTTAHRADVAEHQTGFGEAVEQLLRLAGRADGDDAAWNDMSAQVRWRDTTPRSLAQIADALGKLATLLDIPPRALWERIPDTTDQDLEHWDALADERDRRRLMELTAFVDEQIPDADDNDTTASG